jgi:hypothetical protein
MDEHKTHAAHKHVHQSGCGHKTIRHGDHSDYLHEGHLHHVHADHVDEHTIKVDASNPAQCTPAHSCGEHDQGHAHSATCGHEEVPHGDHLDYLVGGHLHHSHGKHCDDHGTVKTA